MRDVKRLADHERDRLADMKHALGSEHRSMDADHHGAAAGRHRDRIGHAAETARRQVGGGDDRMDARHLHRRRTIDAADRGARMGRTHEHGVNRARGPHVVAEAAEAAQQRVVFDASGPVLFLWSVHHVAGGANIHASSDWLSACGRGVDGI